jgi:hypothetical protein
MLTNHIAKNLLITPNESAFSSVAVLQPPDKVYYGELVLSVLIQRMDGDA